MNFLSVLFTGVTAFAATMAWLVYQRMLDHMKAVERAFVFVDVFQTRLVNDRIWIQAKWKNGGRTPALRRRSWMNWKTFDDAPPADWTWPDLDEFGNTASTPNPPEGFLGPEATDFSLPMKINIHQMELVRKEKRRLFIYGWSEYDDAIGGNRRYRTEFCNEVDVTEMSKTADGTVTIAATYPQFGSHNRAT